MSAPTGDTTATLLVRRGQFILTTATGAVGVGSSLEAAWADIGRNPGGAAVVSGPVPASGMARFIAKTAIVVGAVVIGLTVAVAAISDIVETRLAALRSGFDFRKIETELVRAADPKNDFSPEQRERLTLALRGLVARIQPLVAELAPLACPPPK